MVEARTLCDVGCCTLYDSTASNADACRSVLHTTFFSLSQSCRTRQSPSALGCCGHGVVQVTIIRLEARPGA